MTLRAGTSISSLFLVSALLIVGTANADELDDYLFTGFDRGNMPLRASTSGPPSESWLSEPELRIAPERDEFDRSSQTYSFRFRPTGGRERKAIEAISRIDNRAANVRWDRSLTGALAMRYHRVIDLAWQEADMAIGDRRLSLERSMLVSEQIVSATTDFDTGRLQSAALRLDLLEHEVQQASLRISGLRAATISDYLAVPVDTQPRISKRLIYPQMILSWLEEIALGPVSNSYQVRLARLEVEQAEQAATLGKSRSGFGLSLMELSYEDKVTNSYNVTFGFRLPFGQDKNAGYRQSRELEEARQQSWLAEQSLDEEVRFAIQDMRWQIDSYISVSDALMHFQERSRNSSADAATIGELREHELDLLESAASKHARLLHDFVDLLELTGHLRQPNNRNWIRRNMT